MGCSKMHDLPLFALITALSVATPGAGVLYTVSSALQDGPSTAWAAPAGNVTGALVIGIICAAGLGALLTGSPALFAGMQVVSALLLLWLGWKSFTAPATGFAAVASTPGGGTPWRSIATRFWAGLALQMTNPMLFVYMLSLLPQFVRPEDAYIPRMAWLLFVATVVGFAVQLVYAYAAVWARRFLASPRASLILNRISGTLFVLLALSVLAQAAGLVS
ncbi:LysE family translocator [Sutterella sp.]|uniref:LysE family translocator n=1 Tax=Sutterella sp. TaxID=1981025 RepID=UPI0026E0E40A|nr:LysE family translocator [Sutterella sp.]MDO5532218.1 LysE family translocator [Sutterella sp.]